MAKCIHILECDVCGKTIEIEEGGTRGAWWYMGGSNNAILCPAHHSDAIEHQYKAVFASDSGREISTPLWELIQHIPALVARVRELEVSKTVMGQQMGDHLRRAEKAYDAGVQAERQRCLDAFQRWMEASGLFYPSEISKRMVEVLNEIKDV